MQSDELPQHCIDALAELLLDQAEQGPPAETCCRDSNEATHYYDGLPFCELCRGCYDSISNTTED
jgi:hypothetical protein